MMNKFNDKKPEQDMVINVENIDEIRWNVTNGQLTVKVFNSEFRTAKIESIDDMKDPVRYTMGLLELCASEMDKTEKLKGKNTSEVLMVDFMNNLTEQIKENGDEKFRRIVYNLYRGPDGKEGWTTYEIAKLFSVDIRYVEQLIHSCKGVKRKSGRYPWKQKPVCKDCGTPMKHFGEDCENCGCREYIDKWVDTSKDIVKKAVDGKLEKTDDDANILPENIINHKKKKEWVCETCNLKYVCPGYEEGEDE